ncbi:hypothetical protein [Lentilactobacillus diolivorans]|uniref:Surface layer protein SlpB n=1 Tax=Lentilactobacillus diolivorans TaxID=179838 RepID=A0ABQ0XEE7_9LACO|nr:hypothetical protein [Lentilactobacillus diolivorans]GEP24412.1 hypothetical protein LDI01_20050 [Lentilactobacillus diolivorans]
MTLIWKQPLFLTAVALGTAVSFSVFTASTAQASSKPIHITSNKKLTSNPQTRNVTFTGKSALYTKPDFENSSIMIADKKQLSQLAKSNSSADNFIASKVATTNKGTVYYKVKSYSGSYSGWIYGGKTIGKFNGGLSTFQTFTTTQPSPDLTQYNYTIAAPGLSNDGKTITYQSPINTQYGIGKAIGDSVTYKNASFKIDQTGTRTREGDTWVHITAIDPANSKANGWISYKGLAQAESPIPDNAVRIDLVNTDGKLIRYINYTKSGAQKGQPLGVSDNLSYLLNLDDQANIQAKIRDALKGTGYSLEALTANQTGYLAAATFGSKTSLTLTKSDPIASDAIRVNITNDNNAVVASFDYQKAGEQPGQSLGSITSGSNQLSQDDQSALQTNINTALNKSNYQLSKLSADQLSDLANARFGDSVYLKATTGSGAIADNAVRINFVDAASKKVIKSVDYVNTDADDPAKKGATLGTQSNGAWVLADEDVTGITALAKTNLSGTGYGLTGDKLSATQQATLGAAKFGSSVNIDVNSTNSGKGSSLVPYGYNSNAASSDSRQMAATTDQYVNASWEFTGTDNDEPYYSKLSATQIANLNDSDKAKLTSSLSQASDADLTKINDEFRSAATLQYINPGSLTLSNDSQNGTNLTAETIMAYLNGKTELATLQSPKYPVFQKNNDGTVTINWQTIQYHASHADNGISGNRVKVYYTYSD